MWPEGQTRSNQGSLPPHEIPTPLSLFQRGNVGATAREVKPGRSSIPKGTTLRPCGARFRFVTGEKGQGARGKFDSESETLRERGAEFSTGEEGVRVHGVDQGSDMVPKGSYPGLGADRHDSVLVPGRAPRAEIGRSAPSTVGEGLD
eukprot:scaffold334_cov91-Isochrysis_galbana.AAC.3